MEKPAMRTIASYHYWAAVAVITAATTAIHAMENQQAPGVASGVDLRPIFEHFENVVKREQANTRCAEERASTAEKERQNEAETTDKLRAEIASLQKKVALWRAPGALFLATGLPLSSVALYRWLKKHGYLPGKEKNEDEANQLIQEAEINEEVPTIEKVG